MPVHAVKVETSRISSGTPLPTVVQNLVSGLTTAINEEAFEFTEIEPSETEDLSERYRAGLYRFDPNEHSATKLLDTFENSLRDPAKWYRVRYHVCDHDLSGDERGGCEWDREEPPRMGGDVPTALSGPTDPNAV
jgi:hypothetical protein